MENNASPRWWVPRSPYIIPAYVSTIRLAVSEGRLLVKHIPIIWYLLAFMRIITFEQFGRITVELRRGSLARY